MLWIIAESSKVKKKKVRRNLVGARSLKGLGTLGRLGLEALLLFGFLFDNNHYVVFVFASLFPYSMPFNYCCGCDYFWFRLFYNFFLAYFHILHIHCLIISLNW